MITNTKVNKGIFKEIEHYLKNYKTYRVAIKNLEKQLEYISPNITTNYSHVKETAIPSSQYSQTETCAIKRLESEEAIIIREEKEKYELIINSIEQSLEVMDSNETAFIKNRYFQNFSVRKTALNMNYTEKHIFSIRKKALEKLKISLSGILFLS